MWRPKFEAEAEHDAAGIDAPGPGLVVCSAVVTGPLIGCVVRRVNLLEVSDRIAARFPSAR